jgi:hypothetical protein
MKILSIILLVTTFTISGLKAQILKPVKWSYGTKRVNKKEAIIFFKATIDPDWHVYSQSVPENGPRPTSFSFNNSKKYTLVGPTQEPKPINRFEKVFGFTVSYYENSVIFQQKVKLQVNGPVTVTGSLEYMTCNDEKCLPPEEVSFAIEVK